MKVAIITSGFLPVPASKGGAVENLVDNFLKMNEKFLKADITVYSCYDEEAVKLTEKYKNSNFVFVKFNFLVRICDKMIYFIAKNVLKKEKGMSYRYIVQRLFYLRKVSKYLRNNNYDKVVLENHPTLFLCLKWRNNYIKYKDKYYYHLHNSVNSLYGCEEIIKNSKNNICVSQYIVNNLRDCLGKADGNNFSVLMNCVDRELFSKKITLREKDELLRKYGIKKDEKVILFTGRFTREKGIKELILAFKKVKYKKCKLLIVGSFFFGTDLKNEFEVEIKREIEEIKERVIFTGFVPYNEIYKIYSLADIAVLPSMWEEPAGMTLVESMLMGIPIITTVSGGIPEYVDKQCAVLLERDDKLVSNIALKIDELLSDDQKRKAMGIAARTCSRELTLDNYYNEFIKILKES